MKTNIEIAIECGAIVHADGNIFLTNETKLQAIIDAVNARDSEPVYFIDIDGRLHDRVDDEHVEDMKKYHPIITLFTSPQPNQSAEDCPVCGACGTVLYGPKDVIKSAYIKRLEDESGRDREEDHRKADDILCELLTNLGYTDVVEAYTKIDKWYA